eukprot:22828_5
MGRENCFISGILSIYPLLRELAAPRKFGQQRYSRPSHDNLPRNDKICISFQKKCKNFARKLGGYRTRSQRAPYGRAYRLV